jgi:5-formyltetrahydrofolate cyclo-ligase
MANIDGAEAKRELRRKLRFRRNHHVAALPDFVRAIAFRMPPGPLRDLISAARCVGAYVGNVFEAPADGLLSFADGKGVITALPAFADRDPDMNFVQWHISDPLVEGPWKVQQPSDLGRKIVPDLLLCPLLGFDRKGSRLGQGGGHFDRYFASHPDVLRIGIGWSVQEVDRVPIEPHDWALDAVLTEQEFIVTGDRL